MYVKFKFDEDKDLILVLIEKECNAIIWAKDYRFSRLILILRRLFVLKKVLQIISAAAGLLFYFPVRRLLSLKVRRKVWIRLFQRRNMFRPE